MKRRVIGHTCGEVRRIAWDTISIQSDDYQDRIEKGEDFSSVIRAIVDTVVDIAQDNGASEVRRAYDSYCDDLERDIDDLKEAKKDLERKVDRLEDEIKSLEEDLKAALAATN